MFEQLEIRAKKVEENPVLELEQKLESRTMNHVIVSPFREVAPQYRSCEHQYQPV
jgi:hypothetical protein